jgi:putative spermidine/putrescine transport system ATP-binding protein
VSLPAGVLELREARKHFGDVHAVDGVDFVVRRGEFLTLLGPSGSGKTTILRLVAGFEHLTSGAILIDGRDVSALSPAQRGIGVVFQHYALFPHMTVADNVAYGLKLRGTRRAERRTRVQEMLALVGLPEYGERYPRQLSGGQQQRIAVVRALASAPALMLMDEPLGALDRALRTQLEDELRRIHAETGTTIVYVTHDQEEALALSDRIGVMRGGQIMQLGSAEELYESPTDEFVARFFGECNLFPVERTAPPSADYAEVSLNGTRFRARSTSLAEQVSLVVRPQRLRPYGGEADVHVDLEIREMRYLGEATRITANHHLLGEVVARIDPRDARGIQPGSKTRFFFSPTDAVTVTRIAK